MSVQKAMKNIEHPPLARMVSELGTAIADAQYKMDRTALAISQLMGSTENGIEIGERQYSLMELGFTPTFYQVIEATVEAKVSFTAAESTEFSVGASVGQCLIQPEILLRSFGFQLD